jgi:hypothetical protein
MQKEGREYCGIHGPVVSENKNQNFLAKHFIHGQRDLVVNRQGEPDL